jgi:hypothetical protein
MRSILICAALAMSSGMLVAQGAPIKMGLWEKTLITKGDGVEPTNIKAKSCITAASWQEMVANASKQHEGCKIDTIKNAHGYTFSGTCTIGKIAIVMNGSSTIQDPEHIVSETHSTTTTNGKKTTSESHSTSRYLAADCGNVKPDSPEAEE